MKKLFIVFALFCAFFVISCGSGSSKEEGKPDNADSGETASDEDAVDADSDSGTPDGDSAEPAEKPDSDDNSADTVPDGSSDTVDDSDSTEVDDSGDSVPDGGDSQNDEDGDSDTSDSGSDADADTHPDSPFPECTPTSSTPCIDWETELIWSGKAPAKMPWNEALNYCENLNEGGFSDWRLPNINSLRTLRQNCNPQVDMWGYDRGCKNDENPDGYHSKFGETEVFFWSSSVDERYPEYAVEIYFYDGTAALKSLDENLDVRCVRIESTTRETNCSGFPDDENAQWNSVSRITQTWNWETAKWSPSGEAVFNDESSTTECRFKCRFSNYEWSIGWQQCIKFPYTEPGSGLTLSLKAPEEKVWSDAKSYCENLAEGGFSDWRLPNISELRTLVQNCPLTIPGGACGVYDPDCLDKSCDVPADCFCDGFSDGRYSKIGERTLLWSSSVRSDYPEAAFVLDFSSGGINVLTLTSPEWVRCVR